jgi:hypothetical protein
MDLQMMLPIIIGKEDKEHQEIIKNNIKGVKKLPL